MGWFDETAAATNASIALSGRWRQVRTLQGGGTTTTVSATGTPVVHFASNDYLGLSTHPAVTAASAEAATSTGAGTGASRLIVGGRPVHDRLEEELANWKRPDLPNAAALLFPSGYAANLGVLGAVAAAGGVDHTVLFSDELNHASIIDGARLSRLATDVYPHGDLEALDIRLASRSRRQAVVVSDVVFSMDGDVADIGALSAMCARHDALLVLDVAHDLFGATTEIHPDASVLTVGTLSKMLGSLGGFVVGTRSAIDLAINTARPFIFSTAPPPPAAAAAEAALAVVRSEEGDRLLARLRDNIDHLRPGHPSPIIPVVLGEDSRAMEVSAALLEAGLLVPAIRPPTVAAGTARLRITVSARHTRGQLDDLAEVLDRCDIHVADSSSVATVPVR